MSNEVVYAKFLFSFGSVYIYEWTPGKFDLFGQPMYYWRYVDTAAYYGPFVSIMECTRHWEAFTRGQSNTQAINLQKEMDMSNVIRVDFKTKKRIK